MVLIKENGNSTWDSAITLAVKCLIIEDFCGKGRRSLCSCSNALSCFDIAVGICCYVDCVVFTSVHFLLLVCTQVGLGLVLSVFVTEFSHNIMGGEECNTLVQARLSCCLAVSHQEIKLHITRIIICERTKGI